MASRKPKALNSRSAKSNKHLEPESLTRPEGGNGAAYPRSRRQFEAQKVYVQEKSSSPF